MHRAHLEHVTEAAEGTHAVISPNRDKMRDDLKEARCQRLKDIRLLRKGVDTVSQEREHPREAVVTDFFRETANGQRAELHELLLFWVQDQKPEWRIFSSIFAWQTASKASTTSLKESS